ncbi:uncharacterized protein LOC109802735 [Cajanus cajan]|uniref:uncharacterized protein LOC109802735 n=1 Tax=Cajanus cajan TaxID=3821 RepID=UPI00098D7E61|nr:uncharacterized protein LOC109802735 [Cajanus cajan]
MEASLKLHVESGTKLSNPGVYRRLIGRLLYLTISRPDISYTSHKLGQFIFDPHSGHMDAAHMLLRYLKHTVGRGILFKTNSDTKLHAYLDADWGSYIDSRRSTTGFCVFLGNSLVSWKAKRHNTVSKSSAKVEYRSLASAAIHIASNHTYHERTKHLEIDLHYVKEQVDKGALKLIRVRKHHQLADIFTKSLPCTAFLNILSKLGVENIFLPS